MMRTRVSAMMLMMMMVLLTALMSGAGASAGQLGLSWCSESTIDNMKITKEKKPELSLIEVVVNNTFEQDVVDEVFIRQQAPCEGINKAEVAHLDGENAMLVMEDGEFTLLWNPPDTIPVLQRINDFCISVDHDSPEGPSWTSFLAKFCFPTASLQEEKDRKICSEKTCVRKCCPPNMLLAHGSLCLPVEDGQEWRPNLTTETPTPVHMMYGPPRFCDIVLRYPEFSILPSGKLEVNELIVEPNRYCIDALDHPSQPSALVCDEQVTSWHCDWKYAVLKPVLLGISALCVLIVWIVYVSVPALRNQNEGRCIISLVSALFIAFITLIILNFTVQGEASTLCVVIGRMCHLALLASYFWMNVLSFHNFVTIRSKMDSKWERPLVFGMYSLYAWGCPVVVVVVGIVLDAMQAAVIRPHIDDMGWFSDDKSQWAYLYGLMLLILVVNAVFFVACVVLLSCGRRLVTFTPSSGQHQTHGAWLYIRLFILMGILWLLEVVSWSQFSYCSIPEWIADAITSLQGLLVLIATVCCRRNLKVFHCGRPQLIQKTGRGKGIPTEASEMATNPLVP